MFFPLSRFGVFVFWVVLPLAELPYSAVATELVG